MRNLKTAVAIRHVHFEDLGAFEATLIDAGFECRYLDVGIHELQTLNPISTDLLIVLGGPVGVYETDAYPFLAEERRLLTARLSAGRATLGICLGAQQIAAALGADVKPSDTKEIGFSELCLTEAGQAGPLRYLDGVPVLHWHGDAFDTPVGAVNLAWTSLCASQGFAVGRNILGLQFHSEVDLRTGFDRWLVGHAVELTFAGIDPRRLREEAAQAGQKLQAASRKMLEEWLHGLDT